MLQLYEYEACPFCRMVREALTELDLDALIYPCPRGGTRFRPQAQAVGGRQQFPLLVDDSSDTVLYDSSAIIAHLREHYGVGHSSEAGAPGTIGQIGADEIAALGGSSDIAKRNVAGHSADAGPKLPLALYSVESDPCSRAVRQTLGELELPYVLRSLGRPVDAEPSNGSRNDKRLSEETGQMQAPCLIDPNTDTRLFEADEISRYLRTTYGRS